MKENLEDGAEGFLDALEDVFWIWDDNDYSWYQRRFQGRRTRKGKGKGRQGWRFFRSRAKEKEREKEKVILQGMRVIGLRMNGKEMRQRIGIKAFGPMKMRQHGSPKAGMNGKKITTMSMDTFKEKERKEKEQERKVMDLNKIKEKDKEMGKEKQTMWTHHILLNPTRSRPLYLRHRMPPVSSGHILLCIQYHEDDGRTARLIVVNCSRLKVPKVQFHLMTLNLHGQPSLRWRVEPRRWSAVSGPEKSLDKQWRGRTVFKIKKGAKPKLPEELSTVKSPG